MMDDIIMSNGMNLDGKKIAFIINFPINGDFEIPKGLIQLSVINKLNGEIIYNVYIGKVGVVKNVLHIGSRIPFKNFDIKDRVGTIQSIDQNVVYVEDKNGKVIIYSIFNDEDVTVEDLNSLKEYIIGMSNGFEKAKVLSLKH